MFGNKQNLSPEITLANKLGIDWGHMGIEKRRSLVFEAALKRIEELEAFASDINGIINESSGVAGYHLNGDVAAWGEFNLTPPILAD